MARKVIIDVDPGIDGAVALVMALFDPRLEVLAVTATGGRVRPEQATQNIQTLIEQLDPPRWPRLGAAAPDQLVEIDPRQINGHDGLGNSGLAGAGLVKVLPADKILIEEVRGAPDEVILLTLGPLSNLAQAMQRDSAWTGLVGRLIASGGSLNAEGDATPAAEFNIYADPAAAKMVLCSRMTKTLVPLDVSRQLTFSFDLLEQLPKDISRAGKVLRKILPHAFRAQRQILGREDIQLTSVVPIVMLTNPELFETHAQALDIECEGTLTTGMTVFDRRPVPEWRNNIEVAQSMDVTSVRDCVLRSLQHAGSES